MRPNGYFDRLHRLVDPHALRPAGYQFPLQPPQVVVHDLHSGLQPGNRLLALVGWPRTPARAGHGETDDISAVADTVWIGAVVNSKLNSWVGRRRKAQLASVTSTETGPGVLRL